MTFHGVPWRIMVWHGMMWHVMSWHGMAWHGKVGWLCWGLTSQSTIFQSCRDGAIASWVINQYFRGVKCLAQGHNTALRSPTLYHWATALPWHGKECHDIIWYDKLYDTVWNGMAWNSMTGSMLYGMVIWDIILFYMTWFGITFVANDMI